MAELITGFVLGYITCWLLARAGGKMAKFTPVKPWKRIRGGMDQRFRECPECGALIHDSDAVRTHLGYHETLEAWSRHGDLGAAQAVPDETVPRLRAVDWLGGLRQALGVAGHSTRLPDDATPEELAAGLRPVTATQQLVVEGGGLTGELTRRWEHPEDYRDDDVD